MTKTAPRTRTMHQTLIMELQSPRQGRTVANACARRKFIHTREYTVGSHHSPRTTYGTGLCYFLTIIVYSDSESDSILIVGISSSSSSSSASIGTYCPPRFPLPDPAPDPLPLKPPLALPPTTAGTVAGVTIGPGTYDVDGVAFDSEVVETEGSGSGAGGRLVL